MLPPQRSALSFKYPLRVLSGLLLMAAALTILARAASAQEAGADAAGEPDVQEAGAGRKEVLSSLQEIQRKYGGDAVMMEGHLLGHAIRSGSIREAEISVPGIEERAGKRFLAFKLETGIVYNDRQLNDAARQALVWRDIVEATVRKFRALTVPADGIVITLGYTHKPYADEADLRAHLGEGAGDAEAAAFYLLVSDITELIANRITGQQLIDRATVLINGTPTRLVLDVLPPPL